MKRQSGLVIALCLIAVVCFFGWSGAAQSQKQTSNPAKVTFEYMYTNNWSDVQSRGAEGWELVSVNFISEGVKGTTVFPNGQGFYLKRASTNR